MLFHELNFDEFDKNALIGNDGKPRGYSGVNVPFIEQYKRMISKAYEELKKRNILRQDTEEKIDLEGYSHQGVRAQRFAMLAPEKIRSVFIGGAYSSNPIPLEELDGEDLDYPIGFKGVDKIIGEDGTDRVLSDYKNVVDFLIIAFCIFMAVKVFNKIIRKEEKKEIKLLTKNKNTFVSVFFVYFNAFCTAALWFEFVIYS